MAGGGLHIAGRGFLRAGLALWAAGQAGGLVVRPPTPVFLDPEYWQQGTPHAAPGAELLAATATPSALLSDECFWGSGEPEQCELEQHEQCELELEQCDLTLLDSVAPLPPAGADDAALLATALAILQADNQCCRDGPTPRSSPCHA